MVPWWSFDIRNTSLKYSVATGKFSPNKEFSPNEVSK